MVYEKDNEPFTSRAGDPQILIVFADRQAREVASMFTLSAKAGWTLARLMSAAGADLAKMKAKGVEPAHFANPRFGDAQLLRRELLIQVEYETDENGKERARLTPIKRESAGATPVSAPPAEPAEAPPAVSSAPDDGPPGEPEPEPVAPAVVWDKPKAWAQVRDAWGASGSDVATKAKRDQAWLKEINNRAARLKRPEATFASDDWQAIAEAAALPF